jgi:protein O-GlcNAc transferase
VPNRPFSDPRQLKALRALEQAVAFQREGLLAQAEESYARLIKKTPDYFDALHFYGLFKYQQGNLNDALKLITKATKINPRSANAFNSLGVVLGASKRHADALASFDSALSIDRNHVSALSNRGNSLNELRRFQDAIDSSDRALALNPQFLEAYIPRGAALLECHRYSDALESYQRAIKLNPNYTTGWVGCGNALAKLGRCDEALAAYNKALSIKPDEADAWLGGGNVFHELKRYDEALAAYDKALSSRPDLAGAWLGRGNVFAEQKRYDAAYTAYDKAVSLNPDVIYAQGARLHAKLHLCDWANLQAEISRLLVAIKAGKLVSLPFVLLSLPSSASDQLRAAKRYDAEHPAFPAIWRGDVYRHDRIRVAYLSPDLSDHVVAQQTAGLFEQHDRSRFEVTAVSFGPNRDSALSRRIKSSFERFLDVGSQSDHEVAELLRRLEIDIAVDLAGYTSGCRPNILARRPAPVQVNYLGYAGTMGAGHIDYILADQTVVPRNQLEFFSERTVWLPDSFMANDARRVVSERTPTRRECGLPETGLVFCCFNNTYKILPGVFQIWMRLLQAVEGGVLWLAEGNPTAMKNLRREADSRGVSPERLIFAPKVPALADHLARYRLADMFLGTWPYNGHATASDALWAGLPVLTQVGETFAGRVAASLLSAIGLPGLIAQTPEQYESLAIELARNPDRLAAIKDKLEKNRLTTPLFDTKLFTRRIEAAYQAMYDKYQAGLPPDDIIVPA